MDRDQARQTTAFGRARAWMRRALERPGTARLGRQQRLVAAAGEQEGTWRACSGAQLQAAVDRLRQVGAQRPFREPEWVQWCALGRELAWRTVGERPFNEQLLAMLGLATGHAVEMATGEGKTLAGAVAALGYALQQRRVHVVAVNEYLARRDAEWMGPLYAACGVSVGWVDQHASGHHRQQAYAAAVTYGSVSELGFDVLRDRLRTSPQDRVQPAPDVALVDEVDSVLIDEACAPLVLAGATDTAASACPEVDAVLRQLAAGQHYTVAEDRRTVHLTDAGLAYVEAQLGGIDLYAEPHRGLLSQVHVGLYAHVLLQREVDYLVHNGQVQLVDQSRGRVARLQRWPDGLQAAVETKEGLPPSPAGEILDSLTVQALLQRYPTVCGMSGTALAVAEPLQEFYRLPVAAIGTHQPCQRQDHPDRIYATQPTRDQALVTEVAQVHATGRPVLVGTRSVAESEQLAAQLAEHGIVGTVLNAKHDATEATIVARAGEYARVTIATQMAGRGTDIRLGGADEHDHARIAALGGLCVLGAGHDHSLRLDDQLRGRAGRQGDPGSTQFFASLDDEQVTTHLPETKPPSHLDADGQVHDTDAARTVHNAQRAAAGTHLDRQRTTWRYNYLLTIQRRRVLDYRDSVLHHDTARQRLAAHCPDRAAHLAGTVPTAVLSHAARLIVLWHLDRWWSDHLAELDEIREGIHLRALARESPLDEYHRLAVHQFTAFPTRIEQHAATTFQHAPINEDGLDLDALGLRRPSSTWTYMVTDNPFGTPEERFLQYLGGMVRDGARTLGLRD